ncbi:RidA family protein [Vibrio sp. TBV020]|uniref:RidA family protein n=1 Tax=Vibrio sp. TBV020 TaxID=3137398 RepID=UPI0038CD353D
MTDVIIKASRNTESAPICEYSTQSVAFSHYNNISAQLPIDATTGEVVVGGVKEQAHQCLLNIKAIVESIDHVMDDVVKLNIFVKNMADVEAVDEAYRAFFSEYLPTRTVLAVAALPNSDALVQIDALISNGEGTYPQDACELVKLARNADKAPRSELSTHTVAFSHYNNISAQLPIVPETGTLVEGDVKEQTAQCLRNVKTILESIDVPFDDIVKATIYLKDLADVDAVNEVYTTFFPDSAIARSVAYVPARSIVAVEALPMDAAVQIDVVISHGDGTPPQEVEDRHGIVIRANNTDKAPVSPYYTQTVAFSHYNHIAAQLPIEMATGTLVEGGVKQQAEQCLTHVRSIVESIGHVMDDVVKVNLQLRDIADLDEVNDVYTSFFEKELPARTVIGVSDIPMGAAVQMDVIISNAEGTPPKQ